MKRIHEKASTAADDAAGDPAIVNHSGFLSQFAAFKCGNRRIRHRRDDSAAGISAAGTLIHNGTFRQASTIGSLSVPLIQSCFQGFSVTEVGRTELFTTGFLSATITAVTLTAVATAADPEYGPAFAPPAKPLSENIFEGLSHSHPKARLDIGC